MPDLPKKMSKWYSTEAQLGLGAVKACILDLEQDDEREFLTLAFLAINRRVSVAYDGEVRPHVNPQKKPRPVWGAYAKKLDEMFDRMVEFVGRAHGLGRVPKRSFGTMKLARAPRRSAPRTAFPTTNSGRSSRRKSRGGR